jgi:hypothetical protein
MTLNIYEALETIEQLRPEMGMHINVSEYRRGKDDALVLAKSALLALYESGGLGD